MPALPSRRRDRGARRSGSILSSTKPADVEPLRSGLFDPWYYRLQTGIEREPHEAWQDYRDDGAARGLLPNPLTDVVGTGLSAHDVAASLLDGSARAFPVRALFDDLALVEHSPAAASHPGGPVGFYLQHAHAGAPVPSLGKRSWDRFVRLREQQAKSLKIILAAGIFDTEYYSLQTGCEFASDVAAVWHFLEAGETLGLSPSPLYETSWYRRSTRRRDEAARGAQAFAHFLRKGQVAGEAGPHFDARRYLADHPQAREHPGGPLGHFLAHADDSTLTVPDVESGVEPVCWSVLRDETRRAAHEFGEQQRLTDRPPRRWAPWYLEKATPPAGRPGSVAIVTDLRAWPEDLPPELDTVRAQTHSDWTMWIAVDAEGTVPSWLSELVDDPRFRIVPSSHQNWADRANDVVAELTQPWVCWWHPGQVWSPHLLSGLLSGATDGRGTYAAVRSDAGGEAGTSVVRAPEILDILGSPEALSWTTPRSLAAMLLPASLLRSGGAPFRPEAADQFGWDFLVRAAPDLTFVPFVGVRGVEVHQLALAPGLRSAHEHVLRADQLIAWPDVELAVADRVPGRVSLLIPTYGDRVLTRRAISCALAGADGDVEVVVIDNGSDRHVTAILTSVFAADPRVTIRRVARNTNFATASNLAFTMSTGELVVFLNNDTEAQPGWLTPLAESARQPDVLGAQPLLVYGDGSVQSAGTIFQGPRAIPVHLLASHPVEDAMRGEDLRFDAVTAACMAVRAELVASVRGFDPVFVNGMEDVDLCLRLIERHGGHFVTQRSSRVTHLESKTPGRFARAESNRLRFLERWGARLPAAQTNGWEQAGFEVVGQVPAAGLPGSGRRTALAPMVIRPRSYVTDGPAAGLPSLRWAIKSSAPGGSRGDEWGDTFFADDLVEALRALGQDAFVDRRGAHQRPGADHLDDVTLWLRGRSEAFVQPGATNILWIISHPDMVPPEELQSGFDLVYAASIPWSARVSAESALTVRPLLQATNPRRFSPDGPVIDVGGALFVGSTRGAVRPIVRDAVEAAIDLRIFGRGWDESVEATHVLGTYLDNADLPAAYRGSDVVLNDHWADMAEHSLFSNRLFDAVAAGARVVSDPVPGLAEIFGSSVQTYASLDELRSLTSPDSDRWPSADEMAAQAAKIASEHSFVQRATVMLADVLDVRGVAHSLR